MNSATTTLLVLTLVSALVNWLSRAGRRRPVELVTKPLTMLLLVGVALVIEPASSAVRGWFVVALLLSLAGDVFLMLPREQFIAGLASFLLAHVAYIVGLLLADFDMAGAVAGAGVALVALAAVGARILTGATERDDRLRQPVAAYMAVISTMLAAAFATRNVWTVAGAALFYASDATLGWNRFVSILPHGPVTIMVTYHLAQVLLVIALISL